MPAVVFDIPPGVGPFQIGPPTYEWPFLGNGDSTSFILTRSYKQRIAGYNADRLAAAYLPGVAQDVTHNDAYMIGESPATRSVSALAVFNRVFARIPLQQVNPSSLFVTKPPITGTLPQRIGNTVVIQPDATVASYDGYVVQTVTSDSGVVAQNVPTGGTYALTYGANTTAAIAYNASAAAVQTALNLLTSVSARGGVTVTGTYLTAFVILPNAYAVGTVDPALLTGGTYKANYIGQGDSLRYVQNLSITTPAPGFSAGTFTLTFFGQTTGAIAYNASAAAVQTALNLLSEITARGNVTVTLPAGQTTILSPDALSIACIITFAYPALTGVASSLTPAGSAIAVANQNLGLGWEKNVTFSSPAPSRYLTVAGHGITAVDALFVKIDATYYTVAAGAFTVPAADTIALTPGLSTAYSAAGVAALAGKRTKTAYTPGIALIRCNRVRDYYLVGVSSGITTSADIPLPTFQGDPASLLAAIFTGSTEINYEVGELVKWRGGPILERTITTLNAALL